MTTVIRISPEVNKTRETFFRTIFNKEVGIVALAAISKSEGFRESFYEYPRQLPQMLEWINVHYQGRNLYFCPQLLGKNSRQKAYVKSCTVLWSDLDSCPPEVIDPPPSISLETSPGRYQGFWLLDQPTDPADAEDVSQRIAYAYKDQGVDQSGWDLTQLLRIPLTYNMKYEQPGDVPIVQFADVKSIRYPLSRFDHLPSPEGHEHVTEPLPQVALTLDSDLILGKYAAVLDQGVFLLYNNRPTGDWSSALWQLELLLFEGGLSREEVFAVCNAAKCNKFARDNRGPEYLWRDVCRAEVRLKARLSLVGLSVDDAPKLLTESERIVVAAEETFIERFTEWGKSRGDASPQYFEAGAFCILSTILSGPVKLPTSFGTILPNLWFLIMADTTLTRKSTAMDMAMELLLDVEPDAVLATDGSIEGLMSSIASRPGRAGIFWRDEFSGLLAAIKQKDYLAGMGEALTKLYDGKYQKRILRKETIEIRDPIVLIFAGGIRSKILELMDYENITSGFLPRFIFIQAQSDISNFKPIGPMVEVMDTKRTVLLKELSDIKEWYNQEMIVHIEKQAVKASRDFNAYLSPEAWERYNKFERVMLEYGLATGNPEVFTPTMDRLAKSGLKAAVLLAAARTQPTENKVEVTVKDLLHAFKYVEQWMTWSGDVVANVGKTVTERKLDLVVTAIGRNPHGISRSKVMQNYHLTARDTDWILETLEQRGMIRRAKDGKSERLFPPLLR